MKTPKNLEYELSIKNKNDSSRKAYLSLVNIQNFIIFYFMRSYFYIEN